MKIKNAAAGLALLLSANSVFAAESSGLMYGSKSDPYWFKVGGAVKVDTIRYFGDTKNGLGPVLNKQTVAAGNYYSSTILRETSLKLEGGIGRDYSFTLNLAFSPAKSNVSIDEAYVTYQGFRDFLPNFGISVGQVNPGFSLESTSSSKWTPFMEKSLGSSLFGPHPGLGVSVNSFNKDYSVTLAVTNPKPSFTPNQVLTEDDFVSNDHGLYSGRVTFSPINENHNLVQIGGSMFFMDRGNAGVNFCIDPETKSRNSVSLLNTTGSNKQKIAIKHQFAYAAELMLQRGPLYIESEYQVAQIKRGTVNNAVQGKDLRFHGYHAQVAYVLTGEARKRSDATGTLGQITPENSYGAVEAAIRYSSLNLNSQDVFGGRANNITTSLSWYPNANVRLIAEYVNSNQKRLIDGNPNKNVSRRVQSVAGRLQFIF